MLAIVEDQQELLVLECRCQRFDRATRSIEAHAQDVADDGRYQLRIIERGQLGEPYAVRITVEDVAACLDREPGLADAARPGQRHQTMSTQARRDVREVRFASDQSGELLRKIVGRGTRGHCRGSVGGGCRRGREHRAAFALHRRHEAIAPPGDGEQVAVAIAGRGQHLA